MLEIRSSQMAQFERIAAIGFESDMLDHLRRFAAPEMMRMGEPNARLLVAAAVQKAESLGFRKRGSVQFVLELMTSLGWQFDIDPQLPWTVDARGIPQDEDRRVDHLYNAFLRYSHAVRGHRDQHLHQAYSRFLQLRCVDLPSEHAGFADRLTSMLAWLYPQRYEAFGFEAMPKLLERATADAQRIGLSRLQGVATLVILMFALGIGATTDPRLASLFDGQQGVGLETVAEMRVFEAMSAYFECQTKIAMQTEA